MTRGLSYYCRKFVKLNVSRSSVVAPNKPILLLSVIKLISQGQIKTNLSQDFVDRLLFDPGDDDDEE